MAEGDSVFRMARRIERAIGGRTLELAEAPNPRSPLRSTAGRLTGMKLDRAETRGKHLFLRTDGDLLVHAHMGMNGAWHVYGDGEEWRRPRRMAWLILGADGTRVAEFGGPTLRLVRPEALNRDTRLAGLGPDLLDPDADLEELSSSLEGAGPLELGEALLDQRLLAGIGNIYKSESCFGAGIDPWRPVSSLGPDELRSVVQIARRQMVHGAATGKRPGLIYRRSDRTCPRCRAPIRSRGQGLDNRTTWWCPACQR